MTSVARTAPRHARITAVSYPLEPPRSRGFIAELVRMLCEDPHLTETRWLLGCAAVLPVIPIVVAVASDDWKAAFHDHV